MLDKRERYTVAKVVKEGLCTSCGICAGACHNECICFHYGQERNVPVVDTNTCLSCGLCYEVCPGKGIALNDFSEVLFAHEDGIKHDDYAGHYLHAYVGHSTNKDIRYHCATGGMVTHILTWLLENRIIDGAVVVRYKKGNPFEPEPFIATTTEEIWDSRSSKYVVLSMDLVAQQVAKGSYKSIVVVGLPCQIQGWRKLASKNKKVRDAIKGYFAIYCSVNKTKQSMEYYPQRYQINKSEVGRFAFRDDGCLGYMKFENKQGNVIKRIPYKSFWFGTHSFFTNPRCLMCIDQLGELADISFGDIHIKPYSDDIIGTNSIVVRSSYWDVLLGQCMKEGAITFDEIPVETLVRSQVYAKAYKKGAGVKAYMHLQKMFGKSVPSYDFINEKRVSLTHYLSAMNKMLMYVIGKKNNLWWIVRLFDKYRNHER